jgi:hypothetical protein
MTLDVDTPMRGRTEVIDEFGACTHTQVAYILYIYNYIYTLVYIIGIYI